MFISVLDTTLAGFALIAYYYTAASKSGLTRKFQSLVASTEVLRVDKNEQNEGSESHLLNPHFLSSLILVFFFFSVCVRLELELCQFLFCCVRLVFWCAAACTLQCKKEPTIDGGNKKTSCTL